MKHVGNLLAGWAALLSMIAVALVVYLILASLN
jgi:hypothetical protein